MELIILILPLMHSSNIPLFYIFKLSFYKTYKYYSSLAAFSLSAFSASCNLSIIS